MSGDPYLDDFWRALIEAAPAAVSVRENPVGRKAVEDAELYFRLLRQGRVQHDLRAAEASALFEGVRVDADRLRSRYVDEIRHLAVLAHTFEDRALKRQVQVLARAMNAAERALVALAGAAEHLERAMPSGATGRAKLTAALRKPGGEVDIPADTLTVALNAAAAWRAAKLPLGGPGRSDEGFADFLRVVHRAVLGQEIRREGTVLAYVRQSLPSRKFR